MEVFSKSDEVISVKFKPIPKARTRVISEQDHHVILNSKTGYTLAKDKEEFPSIFDNNFEVTIKTETKTITFAVLKRYRWNHADIVGPIQLIAGCSKDDRRVIIPSGIHDYMLERKQVIFKQIKLQHPTFTMAEYRKLTSNVFGHLMVLQGMSPLKAKMMANTVDFFQKYLQRKKWALDPEWRAHATSLDL